MGGKLAKKSREKKEQSIAEPRERTGKKGGTTEVIFVR